MDAKRIIRRMKCLFLSQKPRDRSVCLLAVDCFFGASRLFWFFFLYIVFQTAVAAAAAMFLKWWSIFIRGILPTNKCIEII